MEEVRQGEEVLQAIQHHPIPSGGHVGKNVLVAVYRQKVESGEWQPDDKLLARIRMKPVRTLSGVTIVTVLSKPYFCPGRCVFCPTITDMPKSYLPDEPGAARALQNDFDPYLQIVTRIEALEAVGHPTEKIELLILGGSWDSNPHHYQEWFIKRCFDAMNGEDSETLEAAQKLNETARHRNVGLVIETRPDLIEAEQLAWLRKLGVTKVQLGVQSLDDRILRMNKRGHAVQETLLGVNRLRAAGFKIVVHWMPNLYGATLESDAEDYARLWQQVCPDELKIYPTQLLEDTELYTYWQQGKYSPYKTDELIKLLADIKPQTPVYCRINRVIRDIPSNHVVEGNKRTSLRQDVQRELAARGEVCSCIRCREVRKQKVDPNDLKIDDFIYQTKYAQEHFLSYVTPDDRLAGYLRLSIPDSSSASLGIEFDDLKSAAIIREIHIYGQSIGVGVDQSGAAQHIGLGKTLIEKSEEIAREAGLEKLAVISAVGTRQYYQSRGFSHGELYQVKNL
ncbi:MAG: tRNA uridine(34) 5-carboxymethylaminomethyl modification radical SAM/GNAT enzyme Elp3 [Anaerolineaceae bacterium]|nr:tRNA uridine(34) 5-carboxymethylaminomethyl modification radical SAM/GNAT enzyme Elp3 [Anaerolineaceae bacterium]